MKAHRVHELKAHYEPFDAIFRGDKTFEYRLNDRNYQEGDKVVLKRWCPERGFDDKALPIAADVGYVVHGPAFGVPEGYCVFSLLDACTMAGPIRRKRT